MTGRTGRRATKASLEGLTEGLVGLWQELEALGLSPNEARVLLSLMRLGSGSIPQLSDDCGVGRTTLYPILEGLAAKGLVGRLPGNDWPALWASLGRDEVIRRLVTGQEERLQHYRSQAERVNELLAEVVPENPPASLPYVHMLRGAARVKAVYDRLISEAESELLMFTRPPYAYTLGKPNQAVLEMLARGVRARVIYQAADWNEPQAEGYRQEAQIYADAGVEARLADEVPIKLVVVDRRAVLVAMADPVASEGGYPVTVLTEHPGYAMVQADAFEQRWATACPVSVSSAPAR